MDRKEQQHRRDAGDRQRQHQDVDGERPHRLAQRSLVEDDLEEVAAHRRGTDHAHHVTLLACQQGLECVVDRVQPGPLPHVDVLRDFRRHVGSREQATLVAHLHGDRARTDAVENLFGEAFRHHAARCGIEHERGGVRGGKAIAQPIETKIRDRGNVNQNFRHHHEEDGEQQ